MTSAVFVKRYTDPSRGAAARAHHRWLVELDSGVRIPALSPGSEDNLVFERLPGRHAEPANLGCAAAALGRIHGVAFIRNLDAAQLESPLRISRGFHLDAFASGRRGDILDQLGIDVTGRPVALYKDANVRNFLITPDSGIAIVDFDDLTLAPFGYDLAKLVVSAAMTYGRISTAETEQLLATYNQSATEAGAPDAVCSPAHFSAYAEVHGLLTQSYLHRNGYQYCWPSVRSL